MEKLWVVTEFDTSAGTIAQHGIYPTRQAAEDTCTELSLDAHEGRVYRTFPVSRDAEGNLKLRVV